MPVGEAQQRSAEELSRTPPTKSPGAARRRRKADTAVQPPVGGEAAERPTRYAIGAVIASYWPRWVKEFGLVTGPGSMEADVSDVRTLEPWRYGDDTDSDGEAFWSWGCGS